MQNKPTFHWNILCGRAVKDTQRFRVSFPLCISLSTWQNFGLTTGLVSQINPLFSSTTRLQTTQPREYFGSIVILLQRSDVWTAVMCDLLPGWLQLIIVS